MSERYQRAFAVPEDFPALLKTFTREILRAQPENLYEFGARYFAELVEVRACALAHALPAGTRAREASGPLRGIRVASRWPGRAGLARRVRWRQRSLLRKRLGCCCAALPACLPASC